MKKIRVVLLMSLLVLQYGVDAQGKYAGAHKNLIGKIYLHTAVPATLKGYKQTQGDLISDVNDPGGMFLQVFRKGSAAVIVFSQNTGSGNDSLQVLDLIELATVPAGWEICTSGCQVGESEGEILVALVLPGPGEYASKISKAWRCNRDKIRFESIPVKGMKCVNEGGD